jgi:hypothetical protein
MEKTQLSQSCHLHVGWQPVASPAGPNQRGLGVGEALDHDDA